MRKIVVATHASFAKGIQETLSFIMGEQSQVGVMCAYMTQDFNIEKEIQSILLSLQENDELIVLVDVFGGSVSNAFSSKINDSRVHVITGVNFPMLLELTMDLNSNEDIHYIIQKCITSAKDGIQYMNEKLQFSTIENTEEEDIF